MLFFVLEEHVQNTTFTQQGMAVRPIAPLQKGKHTGADFIQIGKNLLRDGEIAPILLGILKRRENHVILGRQRRCVLALLQNPEAFGHSDMAEVPADRTELGVDLATEVCRLDSREQRFGIFARLNHPSLEVRNIDHAAS